MNNELTLIKSFSTKKFLINNASSAVLLLYNFIVIKFLYLKGVFILTNVPPGRLIDDNNKTASCFAFTSTFHLLFPTSVILPITTSPTSPVYLIIIE